jgi:cell division protein FtsB
MHRADSNRQIDPPAKGLVGVVQRFYWQRRRFATVTAAVLAIGLGYHVVFGQNGLTAYEQKRENARALAAQVQMLEEENERLKGHVDRLQGDPGAIEHQAREELHYTRPGEVIVTLPNETPATSIKSDVSK